MFTGIIEAIGTVHSLSGSEIMIDRPKIFDDVKLGSSIAISGVCLTVTKLDTSSLTFAMVPTTLQKTTLGQLKKGDKVNLERAMKADGRFDGHIVQGHCEGVGEILNRMNDGENQLLRIAIPKDLQPFVVRHGSITIDGVALTIADCEQASCTIALIPFTVKETTLGNLKKGDKVNIESDVIGRYVKSVTMHS